jgi:hypothetical protein
MSTRKFITALVAVLLIAAIFIGVDAWKIYAQGPGGNDAPCGQAYSGMMGNQGMMRGWNNQGNVPCPGGMMGNQGMMRGQGGMMGGWSNNQGMMRSWNDQGNVPCPGGMMGNQGMMMGMMNMMDGQYHQGGMMGGWNSQSMMRGQGGMMGNWANQNGYGMMGGWTPSADLAPAGNALTLDEAVAVAEAYVAAQNDSNLALGEVLQFSNHFYAQGVEVESGRAAFEFLIDSANGTVYPEPGPNMMWNLRYGMHAGSGMGMMGQWNIPTGADGVEMTISSEQARESAQQVLDNTYSGLTAASEGDTFYGYYTFEVLKGDTVAGMLSVNGYNGQVWFHQWHGDFIAEAESAD